MKIESIEAFPLKIPGRPYLGGHTTSDAASDEGDYIAHRHYRAVYSLSGHSLLVKITTDTGLVGWGECQAAVAPRVTAAALKELVAPVYLGADPRQVAVLRDEAYDRMRERGHDGGFLPDAISACDIAVWDLLGKLYDVPVYQLLGGTYHAELPCYVSGVPSEDVEDQARKIQQWMDRGFSQIKISLGYGVQEDVAHVRRLREVVGEGFRLGLDLHWAYRLADARSLSRRMEPLNVWFLECALVPEELENQARLAKFSPVPVCCGEEFRTRYHFQERLARGALHLAQPDIGRLGLTEAQRVVTLCDTAGVAVAPHLGTGLSIYTAASLHLAAATQQLEVVEFQPTQIDTARGLFTTTLEPDTGKYALPPGPGLGVEPIEEKIREVLWEG